MIAYLVAAALTLSQDAPFRLEQVSSQGVYTVANYLHSTDKELKLSHLTYETPSEISPEELFLAMMARLPRGSSYRILLEKPFIAEWHSVGISQWARIDSFEREASLLIAAAPLSESVKLAPIFQKMLEDAKVTSE